MIAVDTSAIIAVALGETEAARYRAVLEAEECLIGAATFLELHLVLSGLRALDPRPIVDALRAQGNVRVAPFDLRHFEEARTAFDRFGKGRHPAALNFGDCISYAVSKVAKAPLLFKGNDFSRTDVVPALP